MAAERAVLWPLLGVANALIASMGLLFVPAGVGIIVELGVLRCDWLAILAGVLVSTVLGLVVTGLVMHQISRITGVRRVAAPAAAAE